MFGFGKKQDAQAIATPEIGPKIGDQMKDGTICAGYYEGKPLFAAPADAPLTYTFNEAAQYAEQLNTQKFLGHDDWRVPSKNELDVLYKNCNKGKLAGTFNVSGSYPAGWYWSSTPDDDILAWAQRFSDAFQTFGYRHLGSSLRLVR